MDTNIQDIYELFTRSNSLIRLDLLVKYVGENKLDHLRLKEHAQDEYNRLQKKKNIVSVVLMITFFSLLLGSLPLWYKTYLTYIEYEPLDTRGFFLLFPLMITIELYFDNPVKRKYLKYKIFYNDLMKVIN